ncbi:MAG TPA: DUF1553 domain-containing protein [Edaphobacter sp.]|nr:DUF1553 domain-containing protein [Edaphobacter sp.]
MGDDVRGQARKANFSALAPRRGELGRLERPTVARGPRFRVEGEVVRDITLAASGLLNPAVGGASVYPPAPAFLRFAEFSIFARLRPNNVDDFMPDNSESDNRGALRFGEI